MNRSSGGVRVRFRVRFQAVKVPFSVDSQLRAQLRKQPPQSSSKGTFSLSEYGSEGLRVRLKSLSEYGSVACLVERPTRETRTEQYSDTILVAALNKDSLIKEALFKDKAATARNATDAFLRKRAEYGFGEYGFKHRTQ